MYTRVETGPLFLPNPLLPWAVTTDTALILDTDPISEINLSICNKEFFPIRAREDRNMRFGKENQVFLLTSPWLYSVLNNP